MDFEDILLSIIVPVHNTDIRYLDKCLTPLLHITDSHVELVVVDDGSDELTKNYLNRVMSDCKNSKLLHNEKAQGPNQARARGMDVCNGKYVYFVDSDDEVDVNNLQAAMGVLNEVEPDILVLHSQVIASDGSKKEIHFTDKDMHSRLVQYMINIAAWWMQIFKKELFNRKDFELYTESYVGEDLATILPVATHTDSIFFFDPLVYSHILREQSIISSMELERVKDILGVTKHIASIEYKYPSNWREEVEWLAIKHCLYYGITNAVRCGSKTKKEIKPYYQTLSNAFPNWKKNKYIHNDCLNDQISFKLLVNGYWNIYLYFWRLKNIIF